MENKLELNFEINELQLNLVDLLMQANNLHKKYEKRKKDITFEVFNINKLEETEYYKVCSASLEELNRKFEEYKNNKDDIHNANNNLKNKASLKKSSESEIEKINNTLDEFKKIDLENNKLDMYKTISEEFDFIKEDLNLIYTFENVEITEEIFVFNLVKLKFIEKTIELITKIILELNA